MVIGEQIKRHREKKGMSQDELARRVLVSRPTISHWETGKTMPDAQSLLLLAQLFDTTIDELVKGSVDEMKCAVAHEARVQHGLSAGLSVLTLACAFGLMFTALWAREYVGHAARIVGMLLCFAFTWTLFRRQGSTARASHDMETVLNALGKGETPDEEGRLIDDVATDGVRNPIARLSLSFVAAVLIATILIVLVGTLAPDSLL